jgi:hypothetical protein
MALHLLFGGHGKPGPKSHNKKPVQQVGKLCISAAQFPKISSKKFNQKYKTCIKSLMFHRRIVVMLMIIAREIFGVHGMRDT